MASATLSLGDQSGKSFYHLREAFAGNDGSTWVSSPDSTPFSPSGTPSTLMIEASPVRPASATAQATPRPVPSKTQGLLPHWA